MIDSHRKDPGDADPAGVDPPRHHDVPVRSHLEEATDAILVLRARRLLRLRRLAWKIVRVPLALALPVFVLGAIAWPGYTSFPCRSRQSEARGNLKALFVAQESHVAEHGRFSADPVELGYTPRGLRPRYRYAIVDVEPGEGDQRGRWRAFAVAGDGEDTARIAGDVWSIDQNNNLERLRDACWRTR
jgi:Tfp pilus assembly protein PilE